MGGVAGNSEEVSRGVAEGLEEVITVSWALVPEVLYHTFFCHFFATTFGG